MLYSLTTRIALVLALAVTGARPAGAADQTILGRQLVVKNPLGEADSTGKRQFVVKAREIGSPDTIVGDPTAAGASLSITLNGGTQPCTAGLGGHAEKAKAPRRTPR